MGNKLKILAWTCLSIALWQVLVLPMRDGSVAALFAPPTLLGQPAPPHPKDLFEPPPISSSVTTSAGPNGVVHAQPAPEQDNSEPKKDIEPPLLQPPADPDITPIGAPTRPTVSTPNIEPTLQPPQADNTVRRDEEISINPLRIADEHPSLTLSTDSSLAPSTTDSTQYATQAPAKPTDSTPSNPEQLPSGKPDSQSDTPTTPPAKDAKTDDGKDKKLGEEPPTSAIDVFRQSAVLLPVGVWECDLGCQYSLFEKDFLAILPSSSIVPQRTSSRTVLGTASLRYGYNDVLQPFVTFPGGVSSVEVADQSNQVSNDEFGIGDVTFGANYLVRNGEDKCADIVFGLTCVAPTGESNFLSIVPGNASLGNGFWIVSPSLSWTRTFDPVVLYATVAYLHRFEREHLGTPIKPGEEFDVGYGGGFAINDSLTYSLQFQWAHQFDTAVDGVSIDDSGADVATIRQSGIIRITPKKFVEIFFADGLTDNSPRVSMGLTLITRF